MRPHDAPALLAFVKATRELTDALRDGDASELAARMARQAELFEALQRGVASKDVLASPEFVRAGLAAEEALALARERLLETRKELEELRELRFRAARRTETAPTARFISQRV